MLEWLGNDLSVILVESTLLRLCVIGIWNNKIPILTHMLGRDYLTNLI